MSALEPNVSVTVAASAGTGKTYLLVSRLLRLLLDDVRPDSIVAITFTRKAAGEMRQRLNQRLYELTSADDKRLHALLAELGLGSDKAQRARQLYETQLLRAEQVKITTFHALCHELLQRFALDAGIDPGFELLESDALIKLEAWQQLLKQATDAPQSELAKALTLLFNECSTPQAVETLLLNDFLDHRSDWWAYIEGQGTPLAYARNQTRQLLELSARAQPAIVPTGELTRQLREFAGLLLKHPNATNSAFAERVSAALAKETWTADDLDDVYQVFYTSKDALRARKPSKAQEKHMGTAGEQRFLALHESLSEVIARLTDNEKREHTAAQTDAWLSAGSLLLEHFQRIKRERNLLDFSDLEWQVYTLLSNSENAHWLQYKLDQRIDHVLIDEFQDTNPTQWHMLYPLLEEITETSERRRSLFIVGDSKQSIYRFRRAAPSLFNAARDWLQQRPGASHEQRLDRSRRSSPAIIEVINQVFAASATAPRLSDFQDHGTHHATMWGRAELMPLVEETVSEVATNDLAQNDNRVLRNPLQTPRQVKLDERYQREGALIADQISKLTGEGVSIDSADGQRCIRYGDIMILVKKRRHVEHYEDALRKSGIPFIGTQRRSLLTTLEVQDMISLCNTLLTPHSNLHLAIALKSPVFACSDADLIRLAQVCDDPTVSWYQRLQTVVEHLPPSAPLARAQRLLKQWHTLVDRLPVHDLLDRIYHHGNIIARYEAVFPPYLTARVRNNLLRFLELSLEVDSGRYPTLAKFIYRLELLQKRQESPDETAASQEDDAVRILTIHAAKGLEAPVVFLADATNQETGNQSHHALIDWPADKKRPAYFLLSGKRRDSISQRLLDNDRAKDALEDTNLLYVALTRARQLLYVSGVLPKKRDWRSSWYGQVALQLEADFDYRRGWSYQYGSPEPASHVLLSEDNGDNRTSAMLAANQAVYAFSAPAAAEPAPTVDEHHAIRYGEIVHRLLELLSGEELDAASLIARVASALQNRLSPEIDIRACWQHALAVYQDPAFRDYFDNHRYQQAFNEVPISYVTEQGETRFGVIDRLILQPSEALILDYKTSQPAGADIVSAAEQHRQQLQFYREGVSRLWPERTVRAAILFTAPRRVVELSF